MGDLAGGQGRALSRDLIAIEDVIASGAKQSSIVELYALLDCFAPLAMTVKGLSTPSLPSPPVIARSKATRQSRVGYSFLNLTTKVAKPKKETRRFLT